MAFRKSRLRQLASEGNRRAHAVNALRESPDRFLATVQIGITVIATTAGAFGGSSVAVQLAGLLERAGLSRSLAYDLALAGVVAAIAYLSLVLGELVPKSLALKHAERYSLAVGRPLLALSAIARPLVWLLTASSNLVLRLFRDRTSFSESRLSREELQQLVEDAAETGAVDARVSEIASRAFDLGDLEVGAIMVPRQEIVALPVRASSKEIKQLILEHGHSRLPVFEETLDQVLGFVLAKDLFTLDWEQPLVVLRDLLRPTYVVPETMHAIDLLKELQRRRTQIAIVVDEQGAVIGLVTIEDLVEELVGEILSEHETPPKLFEPQPDGSVTVQGSAGIHEVNRALDVELPEHAGVRTIGGLASALAGVIPPAGTRLVVDDRIALEVVESSPRRVRRVRLIKQGVPADR